MSLFVFPLESPRHDHPPYNQRRVSWHWVDADGTGHHKSATQEEIVAYLREAYPQALIHVRQPKKRKDQ